MPQIMPYMTVTEVWDMMGIGLDKSHECEGMPAKYEITYEGRGKWMLFSKWERGKLGPVITYCPWCGEKLPEIVITPPALAEKRLRQVGKQMKRAVKICARWIREIEAAQ